MPINLNLDAIKQNFEQKSSEELINILKLKQEDYQPQVIGVIKEILIARNIKQSVVDEAIEIYKNRPIVNVKKRKSYWERSANALLWGIPLYILGYCTFLVINKIQHKIQSKKEYISKPWDSVYTAKYYKLAKEVGSQTFTDERAIKEFADVLIYKLKATFPKGLDTTKNDSLKFKMGNLTEESLSQVYKHYPHSLRRNK